MKHTALAIVRYGEQPDDLGVVYRERSGFKTWLIVIWFHGGNIDPVKRRWFRRFVHAEHDVPLHVVRRVRLRESKVKVDPIELDTRQRIVAHMALVEAEV